MTAPAYPKAGSAGSNWCSTELCTQQASQPYQSTTAAQQCSQQTTCMALSQAQLQSRKLRNEHSCTVFVCNIYIHNTYPAQLQDSQADHPALQQMQGLPAVYLTLLACN